MKRCRGHKNDASLDPKIRLCWRIYDELRWLGPISKVLACHSEFDAGLDTFFQAGFGKSDGLGLAWTISV